MRSRISDAEVATQRPTRGSTATVTDPTPVLELVSVATRAKEHPSLWHGDTSAAPARRRLDEVFDAAQPLKVGQGASSLERADTMRPLAVGLGSHRSANTVLSPQESHAQSIITAATDRVPDPATGESLFVLPMGEGGGERWSPASFADQASFSVCLRVRHVGAAETPVRVCAWELASVEVEVVYKRKLRASRRLVCAPLLPACAAATRLTLRSVGCDATARYASLGAATDEHVPVPPPHGVVIKGVARLMNRRRVRHWRAAAAADPDNWTPFYEDDGEGGVEVFW